MKRFAVLVVFMSLGLSTAVLADAAGSAFGNLTTAQAIGQGAASFGGGVGLGDNATSFFGSFTYGLSQYTDGRLRVGLVDADNSDAQLSIGGDFKWQFWNYGKESGQPFDFAVGAFFEYVDYDYISVFQVGGQLIASYPIQLRRGGVLAPYGRFNARIESLSWDDSRFADDDSESNLEVGLNGGLAWEMTPTVSLYGEFQLDGNDGVFFGIDFNVM